MSGSSFPQDLSEVFIFPNLESSLGSWVGGCVVLRELDPEELRQGTKGIVLEVKWFHPAMWCTTASVYMMRSSNQSNHPTIQPTSIFIRPYAAHFQVYKWCVHPTNLLCHQLHLHGVLLTHFQIEASHAKLSKNTFRIFRSLQAKLKYFQDLSIVCWPNIVLTSLCLTSFPAES